MLNSTKTIKSHISDVILNHAGLQLHGLPIEDDTDLYQAGMKSFSSVQLMLALEDILEVEFPEHMLTRATFRSPAAIERAVMILKTISAA